MKIKNLFLIGLMTLILSTVTFAQEVEKKENDPQGYEFTEIINIPHTSVKNQYRSGTCWSFSGLSFIEAEMMKNGKSPIDLSEMFVVYYTYYGKAKRYVRMHGKLNFSAGGAFSDITAVMSKYGMVPDTVYTGLQYGEDNHVHGEMDAILEGMVEAVIKNKNKKLTTVWPRAIEGALDAYLGEIPESFTYEGKEYTPKTFVSDYMNIDVNDYVMLTSYSHQPFYSPFAIEVPDNWMSDMVYNLPLDEFINVIDEALANGYSIAWAADVSEKGFSWRNGVAVVPETDAKSMSDLEQSKWEAMTPAEKAKKLYSFDEPRPEKVITQENRQQAYDNYETTDDHGMVIVGTAKDQNGTKYYKIKNSWGTDQKYDGYFYASESYVRYKTMSIMINKNAIPKNSKKKLEIK